ALTINGQAVQVPEGTSLLEAAEGLGIKVPTLCHHKALLPYGACRLCLVEVDVPGRATSVQASCQSPALEGLVVRTDTPRIASARRIVAELLLARCPEAPAVRQVAASLGVTDTRIAKKDDDCIDCGLCVRMCEERMGRAAVGFSGRGPRRRVEPPYGKHNEACWTCRACDFVCPTERLVSPAMSAAAPIPIASEFNRGLSNRPAISIMYPQMVPSRPAIDPATCVHLQHGVCGVCEQVCGVKAIKFDDVDRTVELQVGAIVLAPGYDLFDARLKPDLGYGRLPNVITAAEFERILSASGPFSGHVVRPSDHKPPTRIAFIQCVGSRDAERDWCSSVCCMYATKEALIAKEHSGSALETDIFFMDARAFGKGFEAYYQRALAQGVRYIRCRPPIIEAGATAGSVVIKYLTEDDTKTEREYDLVVLSTGLLPPRNVQDIASTFGIALNEFGFCKTSTFEPVESSRDGIFACGPFTEPKDIPETVMQASGAASKVLNLLRDVRGTLVTPSVYPPELDVTGQGPRVGVFVCHCGTNIAGVVDVASVAEYARSLPNVVHAETNLYTCSTDTQERIKGKIREHGLNRVVVASCSPRTHEPLFRNTCREAGLNPYLFEMANIRDQCSWVHSSEPERATRKAKDLVRMALAKARLLEPLQGGEAPVRRSALVIGGGLAGMTSALDFADQGFDVSLVEKEAQLGGNLTRIRYLFNGDDPQAALRRLIDRVRGSASIRVFTGASVEKVEGSVGSFTTTIAYDGAVERVEHGVVVVATGAREYKPKEHLYGEDDRVVTQLELEERLVTRGGGWLPSSVVMIQCVGSRDAEHPYCSRVCCAEAVKNALRIKQLSGRTSVYVLYRDIRTYGFRESFYTKARAQGVVFLRHEDDAKPVVTRGEGGLVVTVHDPQLKQDLAIDAGLVVLSAGTVPYEENKATAQLLKVPLNQDGFFLEAHLKLRPVDFATDGVYVAGLAHSAKSIEETIVQAAAASARAAAILSKDHIDLEATHSHVVEENCDGCAYCVDPCPFHAITLVEYTANGQTKKRVRVDDAVCKGCGTCQATCPKKAIFVWHFRPEQLSAMVKTALQGTA
ncbi:MAG: FAD-dependent oxidoreductase, partial [Thermoanaerobaculales bacterium]